MSDANPLGEPAATSLVQVRGSPSRTDPEPLRNPSLGRRGVGDSRRGERDDHDKGRQGPDEVPLVMDC